MDAGCEIPPGPVPSHVASRMPPVGRTMHAVEVLVVDSCVENMDSLTDQPQACAKFFFQWRSPPTPTFSRSLPPVHIPYPIPETQRTIASRFLHVVLCRVAPLVDLWRPRPFLPRWDGHPHVVSLASHILLAR